MSRGTSVHFFRHRSELRKCNSQGIGVRGTDAWAVRLRKAPTQAENYAKHLPDDRGWPPFVIVVDVGYCIELLADFGRNGEQYRPFPDPLHSRIFHDEAHAQGPPVLADPKVLAMLAQVWAAPMALDPASRAAKATREIAGYLAELAKSIENRRRDDRVGATHSRAPRFVRACAKSGGLWAKKPHTAT